MASPSTQPDLPRSELDLHLLEAGACGADKVSQGRLRRRRAAARRAVLD